MIRYITVAFALLAPGLTAQQEVSLQAPDGQPLSGLYHAPVGAPRGGILLLHMYRSNRTAWRPIAGRLKEAGFHVLALDMRGHGKSSRDAAGSPVDVSREQTKDPGRNPFLKMHQDAKAGIDLLVSRGAPQDRIAVLGASVGCSVALHLAKAHPKMVSAAVLMSPGSSYLGVPSLDHAKAWGDRPLLMLSAEEEAGVGLSPLKEVLDGAQVETRILKQRGIHGTRMLGAVTAIEADIIEWLLKALARNLLLEIPVTKDLFIDGAIEQDEAMAATRLAVPISADRSATVRVSRNRKKLVVGFDVPERYLRRNAVLVYVHAAPEPSPGPTPRSFKISFSPANAERAPLLQWQGDATGSWKEVPTRDLLAYGQVRDSKRWTAEIAIPLAKVTTGEGVEEIRMAFQINGQKAGAVRSFPPSPNLADTPRLWVLARVAAL